MRKFIAAVLALGGFAMVADAAANRLEFYFSTQGDLSGIPPEYTAKSVPVVALGQKAYLWAYVQGTASRWIEVSIKFNGPVCTAGMMYDPVTTDEGNNVIWARWNVGGDKDPIGDNYVNMVGVPVGPVTGLGDSTNDTLCTGSTRHFLIGEMQFNTPGSLFMAVGAAFIFKSGTANPPTDDIYFGFSQPAPGEKEHIVKGDPPVLAYGSDIGATTPTPDLYIIPEPAGLLLLGIAGLALRRR